MRCYWCGEIIEDDAVECKYCHIKIDKKVVEKYRTKPERDKNEKNIMGKIGFVAAFMSGAIWTTTDIILQMDIAQNFMFYFTVTSIAAFLGFGCSFIGTIIAIRKKQEMIELYVLSLIVSIFWILVYCATIFKSTVLLAVVGLIGYFLNDKSDEKRSKKKRKNY